MDRRTFVAACGCRVSGRADGCCGHGVAAHRSNGQREVEKRKKWTRGRGERESDTGARGVKRRRTRRPAAGEGSEWHQRRPKRARQCSAVLCSAVQCSAVQCSVAVCGSAVPCVCHWSPSSPPTCPFLSLPLSLESSRRRRMRQPSLSHPPSRPRVANGVARNYQLVSSPMSTLLSPLPVDQHSRSPPHSTSRAGALSTRPNRLA